jgi:methylenetetrahydrofolate--tRNA-(uracil-5-)-methyltransferase
MNGGEGLRERGLRSIRFAGQITGCEGYVESASIGLIAGRMAAAEILGLPIPLPPPTTAMGALLNHITGGAKAETFQPMNINFGLFPPLSKEECTEEYTNKNGKTKLRKLKAPERKQAYCRRALRDQKAWLENYC